ncbi:multifunctional CCA addition/repair protein [uncultured Succinatimonas sp.]|uniref:multifunctional CCA addition/repair protein n=1 Tax=uncultured Succinatimonas sp. TaxID=1262973 RepID=UPI0025D52E74|nr:multifunctional CCA addition/repair protein [uncultured Succinatimonas sp.]
MQEYLVGGAVRDQLLKIEGADRDHVVVGSTPQEMLSLGFTQVGNDFPVFIHPKTGEEYALARTEKKQGHGYTGFICSFGKDVTLEEDLLRRDLTINAMAMDKSGQIIDPYGGLIDLNNRVLRHISPSFKEDPLRVLRVARFAAKLHYLGFYVADETLLLMQEMTQSGELSSLTPERVWIETQKALNTSDPHIFFIILKKVGALKVIFPEVDALFGVPGPKRWHPEIDSGIHTLMTLRRISLETSDPKTRFAMLCHDLGKALTPKNEWPHHRNHCALGVEPLKQLCKRLKVPKDYEELAYIVVFHHSYMHHLYRNGAEGIVNLLDKLDAWRRPQRIKPFVQCCKCDFLGRKGFENRPFPRADYFLAIFSLCLSVKAGEFISLGYTGKDIGSKMHEKRVELVKDFMKMLPQGEIDDSLNEMPPISEFKD